MVYIVLRHTDYEGDDVVKVFSDKELAEKHAEELNKNLTGKEKEYIDYHVESFAVYS